MDFSTILLNLSIFEIIVGAIFLISAIIQLTYYLLIFSRIAFYKGTTERVKEHQPVSVVISAHDEDYNLKENLPSILNQDYPDFEVVVVNHASTDDTRQILEDFQRDYSNLKIVTIEQDLNFFKGKKFPLSIGIKSAKNEILLLIDADCKPTSKKWIELMASHYTSKTEVVLGYGPYIKSKGLLNLIIRYDTFMIALQYFSFALMGLPYMGVGRNLSYRKSLFYKNKGFTSHYNISSGDDDLFIREVASPTNTKIEISQDSFMYSEAKSTFRNWFRQKQRHLSTSSSYILKFKILLGGFGISQLFFYLSLITLLFNNTLPIATLVIMIIVMATKFFIQKKATSKLGENQILLFSLIGDIIYIIVMSFVTILSLTRKRGDWK